MQYDTLVDAVENLGQVPPRGEASLFGGIHIEKHSIAAGTVLVSHCHVYDHPSILAVGSVELWTPKGIERLEAPQEVQIAAGVKHAIHALTDSVWYCLHVGEPQVEGA